MSPCVNPQYKPDAPAKDLRWRVRLVLQDHLDLANRSPVRTTPLDTVRLRVYVFVSRRFVEGAGHINRAILRIAVGQTARTGLCIRHLLHKRV